VGVWVAGKTEKKPTKTGILWNQLRVLSRPRYSSYRQGLPMALNVLGHQSWVGTQVIEQTGDGNRHSDKMEVHGNSRYEHTDVT
jgi:hypothetical protein